MTKQLPVKKTFSYLFPPYFGVASPADHFYGLSWALMKFYGHFGWGRLQGWWICFFRLSLQGDLGIFCSLHLGKCVYSSFFFLFLPFFPVSAQERESWEVEFCQICGSERPKGIFTSGEVLKVIPKSWAIKIE